MNRKMATPFVTFDSITVNAIETNSGIFIGTNWQPSWRSNNNSKSAFGSITGHYNVIHENLNIFKDDDFIDTPINSKL